MTAALCRAAGESLGSGSRAALPAVLPSEALQAAGDSSPWLLFTAWNRLIHKISPGLLFTYIATAASLKVAGWFGARRSVFPADSGKPSDHCGGCLGLAS